MMYPNEGIDKLSLAINPQYLNNNYFFSHQRRPPFISTALKGFDYPTVLVQCEALAQEMNISDQALFILHQFLNPMLDYFKPIKEEMIPFLKRLSPILCSVTEMELYFDLRAEEITILNPSAFIQCYDETTPDVITYYSPDYRNGKTTKKHRKSIIAIYGRRERLMKVNQTSYKEIYSNPYYMRLEFKLLSSNFNYLNIRNLEGSYVDIVRRHMDYLAAYYNRYIRGNVSITINSQDHPMLRELLSRSDKRMMRIRNSSLIKRNDVGQCFSKINNSMSARLLKEKIDNTNKVIA